MNDQQIALNINGSSSSSKDRRPAKQFAFDNCFWSFDERDAHYASQELVYKELGVSVLESSFQGYNGCIFAYGQTGSGKSYTVSDELPMMKLKTEKLFREKHISSCRGDERCESRHARC